MWHGILVCPLFEIACALLGLLNHRCVLFLQGIIASLHSWHFSARTKVSKNLLLEFFKQGIVRNHVEKDRQWQDIKCIDNIKDIKLYFKKYDSIIA